MINMKKMVIFLIPLLLVSISTHFLDDYIYRGQEMELRVSVSNNNPFDVNDVRVKVHIFGLATLQSSTFDIDDWDNQGAWFHYIIPKTARKGPYLAKITASNDDFRDVEYRLITVV